MRRNVSRTLGLLALVAMAVGLMAGTASAKPHYSKAQKAKIRASLLKAAKHNPKVVFSKGFIKKAAVVNFTLPSTIRLLPAKDQNGNFVSNDDPKLGNNANLDLGPSLGTRTIGLGGKLRANIQFNDAFDGGHLGDVRLSIPTTGSAVTSTSVPLLANKNTSTQTAPENETVKYAVPTNAGDITVTDTTNSFTFDPTQSDAANTATIKAGLGVPAWAGSPDNVSVVVKTIGATTKLVAVQFTGAKAYIDQANVVLSPGSLLSHVDGNPGTYDADGNGGCANFEGDGTPADVDLLSKLSNSTNPNVSNNLGAGPYMDSGPGASTLTDTVLRTAPLTLTVDDPTQTVALPGSTDEHQVGASGGRANLFGNPVNGTGNAVDVTVNLATRINSLAREVDGAFPTPSGGGGLAEKNGNIAAYFNCRQAWTGAVTNHLTGVKLQGSLHISPAITADGKLRIAKVNLSTPSGQAAKVALAACLMPYQLYAAGITGLEAAPFAGLAPGLPGGAASLFNPLFSADTANATGPPTGVDCNASGGPMNRDPFNINPLAGGTSLSNLLSSGAAVAVAGDISVSTLKAEVLIGSF